MGHEQRETMNEIVANDKLGAFMRELFAEEMNEEHEALRQARQMDLAPYVDELADGQTETVSFAVHEELSEARVRHNFPLPAAESTDSAARAVVLDATPASLRTPPKRSRLLAATVTVGALAGLLLVWLLVWRTPEPPKPQPIAAPPPPTPQPFVVQELPPPPPPPTPTPSPPPPPPPPPAPSPSVHREPRKAAPRPAPADPAAADASASNAASVQAKYQEVARDYSAFKKAYGPRLDAEWNDILDFATYGAGEDKTHKLDAKLSQFKKHMAQVKAGGI